MTLEDLKVLGYAIFELDLKLRMKQVPTSSSRSRRTYTLF